MNVAIGVLLVLMVGIDVACVTGVVAMHDVFGRLHFVAPTALSTLALAVAIVLQEGASQLSVKAALICAFGLVAGPVGAHAVARAARVRQFGGWNVLPAEREQALE